jgi:hypothetical protein
MTCPHCLNQPYPPGLTCAFCLGDESCDCEDCIDGKPVVANLTRTTQGGAECPRCLANGQPHFGDQQYSDSGNTMTEEVVCETCQTRWKNTWVLLTQVVQAPARCECTETLDDECPLESDSRSIGSCRGVPS